MGSDIDGKGEGTSESEDEVVNEGSPRQRRQGTIRRRAGRRRKSLRTAMATVIVMMVKIVFCLRKHHCMCVCLILELA